jgi:EmrB/QacA subfamily drug resistance transporter
MAAAAAPPPRAQQPDPDRWWTLAAVCVAVFMLLLDITIVNVALPDIGKALHSSFTDLQWVIDAYALSLAALLLTAGSLADRFGRRAVFTAGLAVFTAASLLCGLATSPTFLNVARALQGIGGAAMFATSLALLAAAFQGSERGTAFGIWGATVGAAVAIGPLAGGVLTEGIGWESIFFVNVPIGIAAVVVTLRKVRESRDPHARRVDWAGLVTFSLGLFLLIFALVRGNAEGWGSTLITGFLVGSAVLLVAFVVVESRIAEPMLDLTLFRNPSFAGASIAAFAISASMFSMFLYLTLYLQNALGFSPLEAGLRFLPVSLVSFVVAPIAGRLSTRVPVRGLIGGGLIIIGGGLALMRGLDASSGWTDLLPGFLVAGVGVGLVNAPLASTAVAVVDPRRSGMASGINNTFRQVGIATGTAAYGALFQHLLQTRVRDAFGGGPGAALARRVPVEAYAQGAPGPFARLPGGAHTFLGAFTSSLNALLLVAAGVAVVGAIGSFGLIRGRDLAAARDAPSSGVPSGAAPAAQARVR